MTVFPHSCCVPSTAKQQQTTRHCSSPQAAELRRAWRFSQGAIEIRMPEASIKVAAPDTDSPRVSIESMDQHESRSRQMVAEMMILAGEVAGKLGARLGGGPDVLHQDHDPLVELSCIVQTGKWAQRDRDLHP